MKDPEYKTFDQLKEFLESRKKEAMDRVGEEYYSKSSPHYRDNERYSWAVKSINETFLRDKATLMMWDGFPPSPRF